MDVQKILGDDASYLLEHTAEAIPAKLLTSQDPTSSQKYSAKLTETLRS